MSQQPIKESYRTKLVKIDRGLKYKYACWLGHCPKTKEIQKVEIKNLADRLKGQSHKETLTNILDWQEQNIEFWTERHPLRTMFQGFVTWSFIIGSFAFFGLIAFIAFSLHSINLLSFAAWYTAIWLTIVLTGAIVILAVTMQIIHSNRKIPVLRGLENAFSNSLPISVLLKNKLGVCRDYAKLNACLLSKSYPDADIFFAHAPNHVATGIMIENRLYMLDQRLPILTIDKWKEYRHLKGKLSKLENNSIILLDSKPFLSQTTAKLLDTQQLANTITKLLNIKEQDDEGNFIVKIRWRKGTILYEDDEMVNYSLSRWLQTKISEELIEMSQITRIKVISEKQDIIFLIQFRLQS